MLWWEIYCLKTKTDPDLVAAFAVATDCYIDDVCCNSSLGGFAIANAQLKHRCKNPLVLTVRLLWHITRSSEEQQLQYSLYVPVSMFALFYIKQFMAIA